MRKLASIQKVEWLEPIEGKDRIELCGILGWQVIVKKDEFKVGDKCVYIEIDSKLPEVETFEFLRSKKFVIKTMKMGGVLSQGIVFPLSILPDRNKEYCVDEDVTDILGITKYEKYADSESVAKKVDKPIIKFLKCMMKYKVFRIIFGNVLKKALSKKERDAFPSFIAKTDETRIQNIPRILNDKETDFIVTEKVDGTSATYFLVKKKGLFGKETYEFGVCSRNRRLFDKSEKLFEGDNGTSGLNYSNITSDLYWQVAYKYDIKNILKQYLDDNNYEWFGIQGEIIAPKVQGNKYKVTDPRLYVFNVLTPDGKLPTFYVEQDFEPVPHIDHFYKLPDTVNEVLDFATGQSLINPETLREGVVIRNYDKNISFKAVSPEFLLKYND